MNSFQLLSLIWLYIMIFLYPIQEGFVLIPETGHEGHGPKVRLQRCGWRELLQGRKEAIPTVQGLINSEETDTPIC